MPIQMVNADARSSCHPHLHVVHHELKELKTLEDYWAFLLYFNDIFCSILSLQLGLSSSYGTVGMSGIATQSGDIPRPWELHEDGETEDVLKWSQECPKDNASNHFLQVMLREARPYIMMRACCLRLELLKLVTIFLKAVTPFGRESCMKMVRQKMSSNDPRNAPKSCCMPIFERVILC